jgi:hypothetical protein
VNPAKEAVDWPMARGCGRRRHHAPRAWDVVRCAYLGSVFQNFQVVRPSSQNLTSLLNPRAPPHCVDARRDDAPGR